MLASLPHLEGEGLATVVVLSTPETVDAVRVERVPA
jgi:hypothetical protein